LYEKSRQNKE
jgi:hypothetical protein